MAADREGGALAAGASHGTTGTMDNPALNFALINSQSRFDKMRKLTFELIRPILSSRHFGRLLLVFRSVPSVCISDDATFINRFV